ncbi:MAG: hypothetical protein HY716_17415 [Planctomycetes bacterium]|nr:hypothetical protein [Planctomycetota bacterium]
MSREVAPAGGSSFAAHLRRRWFVPALLVWVGVFGIYEVLERTLLSGMTPEGTYILHILRGTVACFLAAAIVAGLILRDRSARELPTRDENVAARVRWLIRLRWIAIAGVIAAILAARFGFGLLSRPAVVALSVIAGLMALYNLVFLAVVRRIQAPWAIAFTQIFLDLIALTLLLYYSGGINNPFFSFFVFHVIIAGILLRRSEAYVIATLASALFCGMVVLDRTGLLPVHPLGVFPSSPPGYALGLLIAFVATTFFSTYFITTIMSNLRRTTRELAREKAKLEDIVQGIGAGLVVLDPDFKLVWMNDQAIRWFGDQPSGVPCAEMMWQAAGRCQGCAGACSRSWSTPHRLNGHHFLETHTVVRDADGRVANVLVLVQETTAQKKMEEQLAQASKMAAVGGLASGIAHELNNPLASISASVGFLKEVCEEQRLEDPFPRHLKRVEEHIFRCKDIIDSLLGFARREETVKVPIDVSDAVQEALQLAGQRLSACTNIPLSLPRAIANPRFVQQILINLLRNAREAAGAGGRVEVSADAADGGIRLAVKDDGPGIAPDVLPRIFEPFFTTKPVGQGTGLGLFLSHRMAEAMGGRIDVHSEPGGGSTFTLTLKQAQGDSSPWPAACAC